MLDCVGDQFRHDELGTAEGVFIHVTALVQHQPHDPACCPRRLCPMGQPPHARAGSDASRCPCRGHDQSRAPAADSPLDRDGCNSGVHNDHFPLPLSARCASGRPAAGADPVPRPSLPVNTTPRFFEVPGQASKRMALTALPGRAAAVSRRHDHPTVGGRWRTARGHAVEPGFRSRRRSSANASRLHGGFACATSSSHVRHPGQRRSFLRAKVIRCRFSGGLSGVSSCMKSGKRKCRHTQCDMISAG